MKNLLFVIGLITLAEESYAAKPSRLKPTVSITSPANGSSHSVNSSVAVSANASNAIKVQFFANNVMLCEDLISPYTCSYTAPNSAQTVALKAVAISKDGLTAQQSISLSITAPVAPVVTQSTVEVYPGCELPGSLGRQLVLDGNQGQTLQKAINENQVLPGDHVILKGPQGSLKMSKYSHPSWVNSLAWTRIEGQGAIFTSIDVRNMSRLSFSNLDISSGSGTLVLFAGANDIIFSDSRVYGTLDSSSWGPAEWLAAPSGISSDNSRCVSFLRNKLFNLRSGLYVSTRGTTVDTAVVNGLVKGNELRNISSDFMRPIGSNITLEGNKGYDGYLSSLDGDANHDDFIQGYALNGIPYDNVKIIDNYFLETSSPTRQYKSTYQGISVFDGEYSNYLVKGNTVIGSAYHGISMYGGTNGVIENNTVVSAYPNFGRNYRISTPVSKEGIAPVNIIVRNNFANAIIQQSSGVSYSNNAVVAPSSVSLHMTAYDTVNFLFDLRFLSTSIYYGKNIGDQTPN